MVATQEPSTEIIDKLTNGAYPAFAMLAGMQLDLFTHIGHGPMTGEEIAKSLGVSETIDP